MTIANKKIPPLSQEIFVFGSNLAGRHGKGAAYIARKEYGAIYGQGAGLQGNSYAIPTKDEGLRVLSLDKIKQHVNNFIKFAAFSSFIHPEFYFIVTEIGCGLAGYSPTDIAPMFKEIESFDNVKLPLSFLREINYEKYCNGRI